MLNRVVYMPLETVSMNAALARAVHDPQGQLLAGQGQLLSDVLRDRLRKKGVTTVPVHALLTRGVLERRRESVENSYDHLFRHWSFTPVMRQLRRLLTQHRLGTPQ